MQLKVIKEKSFMADSPLLTKSKEFALQIIKFCNVVKTTKHETVLTKSIDSFRHKC